MTVPDFQQIMLPLLQLTSDGEVHRLADAIRELAARFGLSEADRVEMVPSGKQTRFANRVGWARTYLSKAGLLHATGHGSFQITERGRQALADAPSRIGVDYLEQFPEYLAFKSASNRGATAVAPARSDAGETPEEAMAANYEEFLKSLSEDLLQQVKNRPPEFFENLVVDLLVRMGYGGSFSEAGMSIGRTGDGGVDGIIKEDKLGLDVVYIQAKRWEGTVGRPVVQAFAGSLEGHRARKGVLITTSGFSADAREYVDRIEKRIVLIDGQQLVNYMITHGLGVTEVVNYSIKRIALDDLEYAADPGLLSGG